MVPARNLLRRQYHNYGCSDDIETTVKLPPLVRSNILPRMANNHQEQQEQQDREEPAHRSRDDSWLQLGIGPSAQPAQPDRSIGPSLELELSSSSRQWGNCSGSSGNNTIYDSNSRTMAQYYNYNVQRFPFAGPPPAAGGPHLVVGMPDRRRRPQSGVWFLLKAAENQVREPFLPQIPKSYLRIKDCRMTIRLLMKYLVNKLGLRDESEVQISCRGHALPHFFTLQHVRDSIWRRVSEEVTILSDSPADHIMRLQYSRGP